MVSINDAHSDQHAKIISAQQTVVLSFGTSWDTWDANPNFKPDGCWLLAVEVGLKGTIGGIKHNEAMKNVVTHIFQRAPKCVPICVDVQTEVTITAVVHYSLRLM